METTLSSTATPELLHAALGDQAELVITACNAYQAQQAAEHVQAVLMATRHSAKAQQRHQALEAAVIRLLENQEPDKPLDRYTPSQRVNAVAKRMTDAPAKYGLPKGWKSSGRKERFIRQVIKNRYKTDSSEQTI